jgi:hypothetical protein
MQTYFPGPGEWYTTEFYVVSWSVDTSETLHGVDVRFVLSQNLDLYISADSHSPQRKDVT